MKSRGHGEKLTRKQELVIACLLAQPTVAAAAAAAGVSERAVYSWQRRPCFRAAYQRARQQLLERVVGRLLSLCGRATETLEKNLDSGQPAAANRAAELILAQAVRGLEVLDLAERLTALEERAK